MFSFFDFFNTTKVSSSSSRVISGPIERPIEKISQDFINLKVGNLEVLVTLSPSSVKGHIDEILLRSTPIIICKVKTLKRIFYATSGFDISVDDNNDVFFERKGGRIAVFGTGFFCLLKEKDVETIINFFESMC